MDMTTAATAAGQPHREPVMIVVPAGKCRQLGHGRAAELAAPDHEHLIEEPALLEVRQEMPRWPGPIRRRAAR